MLFDSLKALFCVLGLRIDFFYYKWNIKWLVLTIATWQNNTQEVVPEKYEKGDKERAVRNAPFKCDYLFEETKIPQVMKIWVLQNISYTGGAGEQLLRRWFKGTPLKVSEDLLAQLSVAQSFWPPEQRSSTVTSSPLLSFPKIWVLSGVFELRVENLWLIYELLI